MERDYANLYNRFVSFGPLARREGIGAHGLPVAMLIGCITAGSAFGVLALFKKIDIRAHALPFGPFLAVGLVVARYFDFTLLL